MKADFEAWYNGLGQVALAFLGGLIGALMRREVSSWQTALVAAAGAGFVGFLVAKFCRAAGLSEDLTYAFVGVAGWLGAARTIDYLERLIENRLGTRFPHRQQGPAQQGDVLPTGAPEDQPKPDNVGNNNGKAGTS